MRVVYIDTDAGKLSADFCGGFVMFHLTVRKWGAQRLKAYRAFFDALLVTLRERGYKAVYATPYESDKTAQRLISMFGFHSLGSSRGLRVMQRKINA